MTWHRNENLKRGGSPKENRHQAAQGVHWDSGDIAVVLWPDLHIRNTTVDKLRRINCHLLIYLVINC